MPEPRTMSGRERIGIAAVTYEPGSRNQAAAKRRRRRGATAPGGRGPGAGALPVEIRNGLPFKPYVYRGLGYDQLTGGGDDFPCCQHCEHTDQLTDPCGQHDQPCDHGCNDEDGDDA